VRTLPDIAGKDIKTVAAMLADTGVLVMQETEYNSKYPNNTVMTIRT